MKDDKDEDKEPSPTARLLAILILAGFFTTMFYCAVTISKGIIREAVIEAIEHTRAKP